MNEPNWKQYIRPYSYIITLLIFFILMLLDGNYRDFKVKESYINILEAIINMMIAFYFTSRGLEKIIDIIQSKSKPTTKNSNDSSLDDEIPEIYKLKKGYVDG